MDGFDVDEQQKEKIKKVKKEIIMKTLTKEAIERLGRVRVVNPQLANQVEMYIIQLYQAGQIKELINDEKLKEVLKVLSQNNKNFNIKRL